MISEIFSEESSVIARLDPRVRILSAVSYSCLTALLKEFSSLSAAMVISVIAIGLSGQHIRTVIRRLAVVNGLILAFWVLLPLTYGKDIFYYVGPLGISRTGIVLATQMTLKSNAILLVFIALIASMPINTLGYALERLYLPSKMIYMLMLAYRYIFVIEQEYRKLIRAAKIRGFSPKTDIHTYKTFAWLVGMLFVQAAARAERVYQAMKCRGFSGRFYSLRNFEISQNDRICAGLTGIIMIMLIFLEWGRLWQITL